MVILANEAKSAYQELMEEYESKEYQALVEKQKNSVAVPNTVWPTQRQS